VGWGSDPSTDVYRSRYGGEIATPSARNIHRLGNALPDVFISATEQPLYLAVPLHYDGGNSPISSLLEHQRIPAWKKAR